jgi:hypothetical protein
MDDFLDNHLYLMPRADRPKVEAYEHKILAFERRKGEENLAWIAQATAPASDDSNQLSVQFAEIPLLEELGHARIATAGDRSRNSESEITGEETGGVSLGTRLNSKDRCCCKVSD